MKDVLSIEGLELAFGRKKKVLRGLDLRVAPGKVTVLLGINGAGKTSLLRVLLGVLRPQAGKVRVLGRDPLRAHGAALRRVGYVPDTPDAYPWMRVGEFYAFLRPHYPGWNDAHCRVLAESLQVPLGSRFRELSRGQGMKAMLVAALAPEPELLLLDEPFAGLDPLVREEVLQGVVGALRDGERTVLCATHELDVAARIADRVAVLHDGRTARHGELAEILGEDEPRGVPQGLQRALAEANAAEVSA